MAMAALVDHSYNPVMGMESDSAITDCTAGWAKNLTPTVELYLEQLATDDPDALIALIYNEFCLAESAGFAPEPGLYLHRFPDLRQRLRRLFELHGALDDSVLCSQTISNELYFPEAGDEIGPYRLIREMGRGGLARVFLAEQSDLNDRLVVLKVSARPSREAALQARVRHPHIVEVLCQAEAEGGDLHLIAMPFLGGATLAAILAEESPPSRWLARSGRSLLEALDRVSAPEYLAVKTFRSASRDYIAGMSRTKAVAWMVGRLAEALDHAACLGVTHGDLKPANILIAASGNPLLFDFNLATDWLATDGGFSGPTGGTLAYMAPEQLRSMADSKCVDPPCLIDHQRANPYSLGLVLQEMLTAVTPRIPDYRSSNLRKIAGVLAKARESKEVTGRSVDGRIPRGLKSILDRCLAPDPVDRYSRMEELAKDLDLWVEDRPTQYAKHLPRLYLWLIRHRVAVAVVTTLIVAASGVAMLT